MLPFKAQLTAEEIEGLARFVRGLRQDPEAREAGQEEVGMAAQKTLNVALIGYAFMGRAHSNAYRQVGPSLKPRLRPKMKVIVGRSEPGVKRAAAELGWEEWATDWRDGGEPARHRPRGRGHSRRQPRRDRHRGRPGGQGRALREAAGQRPARPPRPCWPRWRRPACPTWSATTTGAPPRCSSRSSSSPRASWAASTTTAAPTCRTGSSTPTCPSSGASRRTRRARGRWATSPRTRSTSRGSWWARSTSWRRRSRPTSSSGPCPRTRRRRARSRWTTRPPPSCASRTAPSAPSRARGCARAGRTTTGSRSTAARAAWPSTSSA